MPYDYATVNFPNLQKLHDNCDKIKRLWMRGDYADNDTEAANATPEHPCQTPACLVGNGPSCGVPMDTKYINTSPIDFTSYMQEQFINDDSSINDHTLGNFTFGYDWPDSIPEAKARLKLVLDKKVPDEWDYSRRFAT